jgi:high-affinity Fe2+/Pb2+ permease
MRPEPACTHPKGAKIATAIAGGIAAVTALAFLFGAVLMWLWNALLPELFGLKTITYWQGVGLIVLARLLFGAFGQNVHAHIDRQRKRWREREGYDAWWKAEGQQAFDTWRTRTGQDTAD